MVVEMRIAFECYTNDGEHYSTRYCDPEDIMETIKDIGDNELAIKGTYLTDVYGHKVY